MLSNIHEELKVMVLLLKVIIQLNECVRLKLWKSQNDLQFVMEKVTF
jgi:hypothetical protein